MNKIEDIINCYKKIPIKIFFRSNLNEFQLLLDEKLFFYTKLIDNTCTIRDAASMSKIMIMQDIEIEGNDFKKRIIRFFGTKDVPFSTPANVFMNSCAECWKIQ
jgi:hypothetical protein